MIISDKVGSRVQIDLINYRQNPDGPYNWILCYVDHHSGFGHIKLHRNKSYKEVGRSIIQILGTAPRPEILHSNNGTEFSRLRGMLKSFIQGCSTTGIYLVNEEINGRPQTSKNNLSPYEIYYGKANISPCRYVFNSLLTNLMGSEFSIEAVQHIMEEINKKK
jgi:hypothetical protein